MTLSGILRLVCLFACCALIGIALIPGASAQKPDLEVSSNAARNAGSRFSQRPVTPLRFKSREPRPEVHQDAPVDLELDLCVVGGTNPDLCPPDPADDDTYVASITYTYGQFLDGVVRANATSGTITIYANQVLFCTLQIGIMTLCPATSTIFDSGSYVIVANYNANDGSPIVVSLPVTVTIAQDSISSLAVTSSANPAAFGTSVVFTAQAAGNYSAIPTGQVTFSDGAATLGTAVLDATGAAEFTTSMLALGKHTIIAAYPGSVDFLAAQDAELTQTIVPPATSTTLVSNLNPSVFGDSVTFTASVLTVAGLHPSGAVDFNDGTKTFATVLVSPSGTAQSSISTLASGTHNITASYSGDAATSPSTSPVLVQQVTYPLTMAPPGYTLTATPSPVVLGVGLTAHLVVTVTPTSGFSASVTLGCANLPKETACTFGESVIPAGGGTTTLDLSTMAPHDCGSTTPYFRGQNRGSAKPPGYSGLLLAGVFVLLFPKQPFKRYGRILHCGMIAVCGLIVLGAAAGCSSHCTDFGTYPGSYTFLVTGTAPASGAASTGEVNVQTSVALSVIL